MKIIITYCCFLFFIFGCKTIPNIESDNKNFRKAEKLFDIYFKENDNAFLFSVGTIGPKYIWTHISNQKIKLTIIDIFGKKSEKTFNNIQNWTDYFITEINIIECPLVLDGDLLKIKFKNNKGNTVDKSFIHDLECLEKKKIKK